MPAILGWWDDGRAAWSLLIVDDHAEFRASARALLDADGFDVVGEAADGESALEAARDGIASPLPSAWPQETTRRCDPWRMAQALHIHRRGRLSAVPASGTIACAVRAMPSMTARP